MKESTLDIWRKLQENGYFSNHRLYKNFQLGIPAYVNAEEICNKKIAEIGCGYGRETVYFSMLAKKVYAIDVSSIILDQTKEFVTKHGQIDKVELVLADECKDKIPSRLDYVYSRLVFQHLAPMQMFNYIKLFHSKLKKGGKINIQFKLGNSVLYRFGCEPDIRLSKELILSFFKGYKILHERSVGGKGYTHLYVTGEKV